MCAVVKVQSNLHLRDFRWQWRWGSPVPIPNAEVKPFSADGTWLETARESRSPPVSNTDMRNRRFAFCHSSVAQWQSTRLLTELLQVRVPPGEPRRRGLRLVRGDFSLKNHLSHATLLLLSMKNLRFFMGGFGAFLLSEAEVWCYCFIW